VGRKVTGSFCIQKQSIINPPFNNTHGGTSFYKHKNDVTGKENIFKYSNKPLNTFNNYKKDYIIPEMHMANSMLNILLCSTLVTLETKDVIPVTNYYKVIKVIKNIKSNSVGVKLLSGSCDI
jgi:hypothetical protein